jgi:hypothetical protein
MPSIGSGRYQLPTRPDNGRGGQRRRPQATVVWGTWQEGLTDRAVACDDRRVGSGPVADLVPMSDGCRHSFGADLALRYALRYPHRVTAVVYICGTGLEWSTHRGVHKAAARARRSQPERDRLDALAALAARRRTAGQEQEFLTLTWAADYADHALGLKAASSMAAASLPVNYQLSKVINEELKAKPPHALAAACQALTVPVHSCRVDRTPARRSLRLTRQGTTSGSPDHAAPSRPSPLDRSTPTGQRDPARLPQPPNDDIPV